MQVKINNPLNLFVLYGFYFVKLNRSSRKENKRTYAIPC